MNKLNFCVIKIGSNVLTTAEGKPDFGRMSHLSAQVATLIQGGTKVILVSSGAVAFGRQELKLSDKINPVIRKQIWASMGQIELIKTYKSLFSEHQIAISQILVTKEDFRDRKHFLNMKNCLLGLLDQNIIPIVNENDTVAITELMFTDNDELASLTAAMVDADSLILLTNVDGIYTGPPSEPSSELIERVDAFSDNLSSYISATKSSFGRGGMLTKLNMAKRSASLGIQVIIANGKKDHILSKIQNNQGSFTYFEPSKIKHATKKWLAHGEQYYKGEVTINDGAKNALTSQKISSLLPIGVIDVKGEFEKGDILRIIDQEGQRLGLGRAEYGSKATQEKIGLKNQKPIIHYNYLYIF
ncbi:glutamate 5-kinase [Belliella kenyensis]|uniref:Glutamate 5-kinase n=1 Tax=Belliella kenyensis TaxID=1472724 RepID=A0ABV8EQ09_9BACT|nr:glutamate 5-kinase [Belliella kenyensis]MCH7401974.1 glutamate 5-kinase [Belliella kenyensis]MDN3605138.1 glutamate 5-kinase [Belliella kenyensis]